MELDQVIAECQDKLKRFTVSDETGDASIFHFKTIVEGNRNGFV